MLLKHNEIKQILVSAIRCDGTVNVEIELINGKFIDLYCLSLKQADSIEFGTWNTINIDDRMLIRTFEQEMRQNGVN